MSEEETIKITVSDEDILSAIHTILDTMNSEDLALDEITLDIYSKKTGKVNKLQLFKEFQKWIEDVNENGLKDE